MTERHSQNRHGGSGHTCARLAAFAALAAACLALATSCSPGGDSSAATAAGGAVKLIDVELEALAPTTFEEYIRLTGTVQAEQDVLLSAEESGRVERFDADKGDRVRRGQALAKIDDELLRTAVAEAEAESALATEQYERQRAVWEEQRIGTEIAYLERKRRAAQSAAVLQGLRTRLERTTIRAPFDGLLEARYIDAGEMAAAGSPVVRVLDPGALKVAVGVPERFAADVRVGTRALVSFDIFPDREVPGQVRFVGHAVDPENRTFPIEIGIENSEGIIKPEMVANVRVVRQALDAVLVVPQEAMRNVESGFIAYVAVAGNDGSLVAEQRQVQLGPAYANRVVVEKGLQAGERLIVRGHRQVASGSHVRVAQNPGAQP